MGKWDLGQYMDLKCKFATVKLLYIIILIKLINK